MPDKKPSLYLIDGNSYVYRAFYAIRRLSNSRGLPTNAVYGFTNMLMKVVTEKRPEYLAVCFDPKGPTTRHEAYADYKATRPAMPEDLVPQIDYIHRVVEAFNIPVLLMPGIEADDVIAVVARKAAAEGLDVMVVTADKDMFQLIGDDISIYDTMKDEVYGPEECIEKFGVAPGKIVEYLGLMGDTSDNIPGVPGVGKKTAAQLVSEFGTIEELLGRLDEIKKPKLRENLEKHAEDARLSKKLVTLMDELPEEVDVQALKRRPQDTAGLVKLFGELEFSALIRLIEKPEAPGAAAGEGIGPRAREDAGGPGEESGASRPAGPEYVTVTDLAELKKLAAKIKKADRVAVDTETTSLLPMSAELVGISLCMDEKAAYYIPVGHVTGSEGDLFPELVPGQIPVEDVRAALGPVLADPKVKKLGQNIKYDIIVLKNSGMDVGGIEFDSMVGSYLINPGRGSHGLDNLALEYLGMRKTTYAEVVGKGAKKRSFAEVDIDAATQYSGEDAYATFMLAGLLEAGLEETGLTELFETMELPLISVLAKMEMDGVYVDKGHLREMSKELERDIESIVKRIYAVADEEFNINSPKQLSVILFDKLGLKPLKKTKTGFSTDEEVLKILAMSHDLPAEILSYRELFKLKSTYVDALARLINPKTGRVHTSLNQAVTATGRLSSSEPNLQNIPVRTEMGRRIREAFAAPKGSVIISADYSQVELRIMAHLAGDESLINSFKNGEDVHTRTASEIFGLAPEAVTPDMRRHAKAINFGIMYGMGAFGLSNQIGVHPKDAQKYIDMYFERHAGVRSFIEKNQDEVLANGYSTTLFGRKRMIPELASENKNVRAQGERVAINTPIQGTAADMIKAAMIKVSGRLANEGLKAKMILQVHDELVFEAQESEAEAVKELAVQEMEGVIRLRVPVKVDVGMGKNWGEAH